MSKVLVKLFDFQEQLRENGLTGSMSITLNASDYDKIFWQVGTQATVETQRMFIQGPGAQIAIYREQKASENVTCDLDEEEITKPRSEKSLKKKYCTDCYAGFCKKHSRKN